MAYIANVPTVDHTQNKLNRLKRIEKRFEAGINDVCNILTALEQTHSKQENENTNFIQQQNNYEATFFEPLSI